MQDLRKTTVSKFTSDNFKCNVIESAYLGTFDFKRSVQLQKDLFELVLKTKNNFIIGLEHPAVVTLGYRANTEQEVFAGNSLPVERINRGGLATIHSEGQLVIYPVLNLRGLNIGVREYVCLLLRTTQELLKLLGVTTYIDEKAIGLYTQIGKVAFCGVQVKNGISQHGISLNVRNDLSLFTKIRSCGITDLNFDRLCEYGIDMTLSELYHEWIKIFRTQLSYQGSLR